MFNDALRFVLIVSDNTLAISSRITFCNNIFSVLYMHEKFKKTRFFYWALFWFIQYAVFR